MVDLVAYAYAVRTKDDDTLERLCSRYNTTRALLLASLIEAGGGKTHNAISSLIGELAKSDSSETPLITWMVVPTHAIADEIAEKLSGQIAKDGLSGSIHVQQWKGRAAVSDRQPSIDQLDERLGEDGDSPSGFDSEGYSRNCLYTTGAEASGKMELSTIATWCDGCPLRDICGSMKQVRDLAEHAGFANGVDKAEQIQFKKEGRTTKKKHVIVVLSHFYAFNALPYGLHAPDLVIIDKDPNAQTTDPFVLKNTPEMIKAIRIGLTAENQKREEQNAKKLEKFNGLSEQFDNYRIEYQAWVDAGGRKSGIPAPKQVKQPKALNLQKMIDIDDAIEHFDRTIKVLKICVMHDRDDGLRALHEGTAIEAIDLRKIVSTVFTAERNYRGVVIEEQEELAYGTRELAYRDAAEIMERLQISDLRKTLQAIKTEFEATVVQHGGWFANFSGRTESTRDHFNSFSAEGTKEDENDIRYRKVCSAKDYRYRDRPTLVMDANLMEAPTKAVFGDDAYFLEPIKIPLHPDCFVAALLQKTEAFSIGAMKTKKERRDKVLRLARAAVGYARHKIKQEGGQQVSHPVLIVGNKSVLETKHDGGLMFKEALEAILGVTTAHYFAVRGINAWENCRVIISIGDNVIPPYASLYRSRAHFMSRPDAINDKLEAVNGKTWSPQVAFERRFSDDSIIARKRCGWRGQMEDEFGYSRSGVEVYQTAHRPRPVRNARDIFHLGTGQFDMDVNVEMSADNMIKHMQRQDDISDRATNVAVESIRAKGYLRLEAK